MQNKLKMTTLSLSVLSVLWLGVISNLQAADEEENSSFNSFSWSEYKRTLPDDLVDKKEFDKAEATKGNIKKHHDVDVERRTLAEIREDQHSKNLEIAGMLRKPQKYTTSDGTEGDTTMFGVSIASKFDLMSIGKKFDNIYAEVDVFDDSIYIGFAKRFQSSNKLGLFADLGAGMFFQMKETLRAKDDMYLYGYSRVGYNFENYSVKLGVNVPSDAFNKGGSDKTNVNLAIGWRF